MVVHRLPGREVRGEIAPGTTGAQDVEVGVEDTAQRVRALSATAVQRGQAALHALPLRVGQVARITGTHAPERSRLRHDTHLPNTLLYLGSVGRPVQWG
jgi:hypothetical protein